MKTNSKKLFVKVIKVKRWNFWIVSFLLTLNCQILKTSNGDVVLIGFLASTSLNSTLKG
jgi:hypothetical protein